MDTSTLLIICTAAAGTFGLALGYALGRLDWLAGKLLSIAKQPPDAPPTLKSRFDPGSADPVWSPRAVQEARFRIDINEAKFVAPVDTGGMERLDENELGKTTVTEENVQDAVSRLAKLKGQ